MLRRHALIIEDEILIALEIEALLESQGFDSFDIVDTPSAAVASAVRRRPDLITADYRIVEGTGLEAVVAIEATMGAVPVVFITGNPDSVAALASDRTIIDKPISARRLAQACAKVIAG